MTDTTAGGEALLDLQEAARRLRVGADTVETALERGLLRGERDTQGRWKVALAAAAPAHTSEPAQLDEAPRPHEDETDWLRRELARRDAVIAEKDALIAELARQSAALAQQTLAKLPMRSDEAREKPMATPQDPAARARQERSVTQLRANLLALKQRLSSD